MKLIHYFIEQIQSLQISIEETRTTIQETPIDKVDVKNLYRERLTSKYGELRAYKNALLEVTSSYVRGY